MHSDKRYLVAPRLSIFRAALEVKYIDKRNHCTTLLFNAAMVVDLNSIFSSLIPFWISLYMIESDVALLTMRTALT